MSNITTSTNSGVVLSAPGYYNPVTVASGVTVTNTTTGNNGDAIYASNAATWTLTNDGTVTGNLTAGNGVDLAGGGNVTNVASALISGYVHGIYIGGSGGSVANYGTVEGSSYAAISIAAGTVSNYGTISALGIAHAGVAVKNSLGTVVNLGIIQGSGGGSGIHLHAGGNVTNGSSLVATASITGGYNGVNIAGGIGTVVNAGSITGTGAAAVGIMLGAGGSVTNASAGVIEGAAAGVSFTQIAGTVVNYGAISGTAGEGLYLGQGGTVTNGSGGATGAAISGLYQGIRIEHVLGAVTNYGLIAATAATGSPAAVDLLAGGVVVNKQTGAIVGLGFGVAITTAVGTVTNYGTIDASGTYGAGVYLDAGGTLTNYGTIGAGSGGVNMVQGGTVVNKAGALLTGGNRGVEIGGTSSTGSVANYGMIAGASDGIVFAALGNSVTNAGTITGAARFGVFLTTGGNLTNTATGQIIGYKAIFANYVVSTVTNSGTITGVGANGVGVEFGIAGSTLTNGGTIIGDPTGGAVGFTGGGNWLIVDPGAVFSGSVYGGGGVGDVLELAAGSAAATGTISGLGTNFIGFDDVTVDPLATWVVTGANTLAGGAVTNAGTLDVDVFGGNGGSTFNIGGTLTNSGTVQIGGTLGGNPTSSLSAPTTVTATGLANTGTVLVLGNTTNPSVNQATLNITGAAPSTLTGSIFVNGDADLEFASGGITSIASGAALGLFGAQPRVSIGPNTTSTALAGLASIAGSLFLQGTTSLGVTNPVGAVSLTTSTDLMNTGIIDVDTAGINGGALVTFGGTLTNSGTFSLGVGNLTAPSSVTILGLVNTGTINLQGNTSIGTTATATLNLSGTGTNAGSITVNAGAVLSAGSLIVQNGGSLNVLFGGTVSGAVAGSGGIEIVSSGGVATSAAIAGGTLELAGGTVGASTIDFTGGGTLQIDGAAMPTNTITGFSVSDKIDVRGLAFSAAVSASFSGGTLSVTSGGTVIDQFVMSGIAAGAQFAVSDDGLGGTSVGLSASGGNLLVNGGFEASTSNFTTPPGWTNIGHTDGVIAYAQFSTQPVYEGLEYYDLGGFGGSAPALGDGIEQTVATTPGSAYTLAFGLSGENLAGTETLQVAIGSKLVDFTLPTTSIGEFAEPFVTNSIPYVATGTATTIAFTILSASPSTGSNDPLIDGVRFVPATGTPSASLFDFIFTYKDGKDYYIGTVADDGTFGYAAGQTKVTATGRYDIFNKERGTTAQASGSVHVIDYSRSGPGVASPIPVMTAAGQADGTAGLGSESDAVQGTDGKQHAFSSTVEPSFPMAGLFGFVFTYADGAAFYSGTVVAAPGATPALPASSLGTYTLFAEGVTAQLAGTVVIDRFSESPASFIPDGAGGAAGTGGLGSEAGSLTVNGTTYNFSDNLEPVIPLSVVTVPIIPAPPTADIIATQLTQIYNEVLGRNPSSTELQTDSTAVSGGTNLSAIRATLAGSAEAQGDLTQLYSQIFARAATAGELATDTGQLAGGASLRTEQFTLAQSPEAQIKLQTIYNDVLARMPDGNELATFISQLGDEAPPPAAPADPNGRPGLAGVRDIVAHSPDAQAGLNTLFQNVIGRAPAAAELVGMEDKLANSGNTQQTLTLALQGLGSGAAGYATIAAGPGGATLTAQAGTPTLFDFTNLAFGADTIVGFDPSRDTIELPVSLAANFAALQADLSATTPATITFAATQLIQLSGVAPASLGIANFLFK